MQLGLFLDSLPNTTLQQALDAALSFGINKVEVGMGGYSPARHGDVNVLLRDPDRRASWLAEFSRRGIEIVALNCNGNPLHPVKHRARLHEDALRNTLKLAGELGIETVVAMSGCPGPPGGSSAPHTPTGAWVPDLEGIFEWQWDEKVLPFWQSVAEVARAAGIRQVCLELIPAMTVHNAFTLLRLRDAVGPVIAANLDPSHLFWQGMDPISVVRELKGAVRHVHAKDTYINQSNVAINGVLDGRWANLAIYSPQSSEGDRDRVRDLPWYFCTVGYGHGADYWASFIATLLANGYDGVLSIEHEDPLISPSDGVQKAAEFLRALLPGRA